VVEKYNINEKVTLKTKNIPKTEYEAVLDAFRASMLFFEKELRKLRDRRAIDDETLRMITKKLDLSELTRLKFTTLEPMKLVKMIDVKRVVQEFSQQMGSTSSQTVPEPPKLSSQPPPTNISFSSTRTPIKPIEQDPYIQKQPSGPPQTLGFDSVEEPPRNILPSQPMSAKDTATAVAELRKLMIENLKKFKQKYQE
jgi:hypothetical protein